MRVNFTNAHANTNPKLLIGDEEDDNDNDDNVLVEGDNIGDDQYDKDEITKNQIDIGKLTSNNNNIDANVKIVESDEKLIKESPSLNLAKKIISLPKQQQQQQDQDKKFKLTTTNSLKYTRDTKKTLKASSASKIKLSSSNYVFKVKIRTQDKTLSTESINVKCEKMNTSNGE